MGLYQLIYQSQSLVPFEAEELAGLLSQVRAYNQRHAITGILLYTPDGRFLQVLEGSQAAVREVYHTRILPDPRHYDCRILSEGPGLQRSFGSWAMGFREARALDLRTLLGFVPPDTPALLVPRPHTRPELLALLREFVANGPVEDWLEHPR